MLAKIESEEFFAAEAAARAEVARMSDEEVLREHKRLSEMRECFGGSSWRGRYFYFYLCEREQGISKASDAVEAAPAAVHATPDVAICTLKNQNGRVAFFVGGAIAFAAAMLSGVLK